jgi:hypothetical protein
VWEQVPQRGWVERRVSGRFALVLLLFVVEEGAFGSADQTIENWELENGNWELKAQLA